MSDLPEPRIEPYHAPFTTVGIDCFGPFMIKRARSEIKRYGCVFTCFATRAIHLEMLDDLSSDSFLNAFRRFCARRGVPEKVYSDNATNFVGSERELCLDIEWHFNTPTASHMGGVWERVIRTVRKVLVAVVPAARLTDDTLRTILCEVEAIVNSRPLVKVSDDPKDPAALTPNHLILLNKPAVIAPSGDFDDSFRKRWRCVQHIANEFWKRWVREYLPALQVRGKWYKAHDNVKVGDVVLLKEENTPRGVWPLGLVIESKTSADGLVRSVKIRPAKGSSEIWRPIQKLVKLEASD